MKMGSLAPSQRILRVYDSLAPEAQRKLVEDHLATFFDAVPHKRAKQVLRKTAAIKRRHERTPTLDYHARKREIHELLAELVRDAKTSSLRDHSNRDVLMTELLHSCSTWITNIWTVAYEHHVQFREAHASLLFIAEAVRKLEDDLKVGACQCALRTYEVLVDIRDRNNQIVKHFEFHGPHNLIRVLLWTWRELFVSMSLADGPVYHDMMSTMLDDIEQELGWRSVARVVYGGSIAAGEEMQDDLRYDEGSEEEWEDIDTDESEEEEETSEFGHPRCTSPLHADHWTPQVSRQCLHLRQVIKRRMENIFKLAPSRSLYLVLQGFKAKHILQTLSTVATRSSDNMAAALDIYSNETDTKAIMDLLDSHSHLLRPRDSAVLQNALMTLSVDQTPRSKSLAISILEKQMFETVQSIYAAIRGAFYRIDDPKSIKDIERILGISHGSTRADNIEQWLDEVVTPTSAPLHAVAFAAMMMGIPAPGIDAAEEDDFWGHLNLDTHDPSLADLREELRPPLADRFDGWIEVADGYEKGSSSLRHVYQKMVTLMPFLRSADIAECMQARISERPSKRHVGDALAALSSFGATQRKRQAMREAKKRKAAQQQAAVAAAKLAKTPATSYIAQLGDKNNGTPSSGPSRSAPRTEDDDDGPPPLEPISDSSSGGSQHSHRLDSGDDDEDGPPPLESIQQFGLGQQHQQGVPQSLFTFPATVFGYPYGGAPPTTSYGGIDDVD
ncbi:hypothetical protein CYLTODRAFT_373956 [Cylindrobasidium torrendii FP15055 ss-10]|uniref:Uncharacterized protein n=1 Tax=Cylindrobasidium torrendii FP15055 ss-10 TaxID=1314674 RepID=A0A0D7BGE6_9AGAR|nr:hypothetical protein CYLTODRAFT_373956 [Cylindrobasidium torrendii FP15055 ss-10]